MNNAVLKALENFSTRERETLERRVDTARAAADAVRAERDRIAGELHDIVAHAVSLMLLQAAGAARVLRQDPSRAETALRHIEEVGQQAVVELRRMLGLLSDGAGRSATLRLPNLRDLPTLVDRTRTDTFHVEFEVTGSPVRVDAEVDLSAYRIVQEALTNAVRYADQRFPAWVAVVWRSTELEIQVRNRVPTPRASSTYRLSTGRGIIGMRERAAAVGGRCQAGLQADGSFLMTAHFPVALRAARVAESAA